VFVRAGALLPLADEFDTLVNGERAGSRTWSGDLVVRIVAGGTGSSEFTLYDGARLIWDGAKTLHIVDNPNARQVTIRLPDGSSLAQRIEAGSGELRVP